jgi:hypothetical protein
MSKNKISVYFLSTILLLACLLTSSCGTTKSGCPAETAQTKPDRHGQFSSRKGSTNLFPKTVRKKMGV